MPFRVGWLELLLVLGLALIFFGPGRIGPLGEELGKGIRGFKEGLQTPLESEGIEGSSINNRADYPNEV
jgi:sec-independent protein translocase protein TatA